MDCLSSDTAKTQDLVAIKVTSPAFKLISGNNCRASGSAPETGIFGGFFHGAGTVWLHFTSGDHTSMPKRCFRKAVMLIGKVCTGQKEEDYGIRNQSHPYNLFFQQRTECC